jgi:hypothetical protein
MRLGRTIRNDGEAGSRKILVAQRQDRYFRVLKREKGIANSETIQNVCQEIG